MRVVMKEEKYDYWSGVTSFSNVSDAGSTLGKILYGNRVSLYIKVLL